MLKISEAAAIGIHAVVALALNKGEKLSGHELSDGMEASGAHLAKVMQRLVKGGIVDSERGPAGGFKLAVDPAKLSLLKVYEAIEGSFPEGACLFASPVCKKVASPMGAFVGRMNKEAFNYFKNTTVAKLAKGMEARK